MNLDKNYYIKKPPGYNPCILGNAKHRDPVLNVLPNCTGWATGRFNELGKYGKCKYLGNTDAENYIYYVKSQKLKLGQTPKVGACMVWEGKGNNKGHVAIVEQVINNNEVITSESGWDKNKSYWTQTRKKGTNGRWGEGASHLFKGFIYNPAIPDKINLPKRGYFTKGDRGEDIIKINDWLYERYKHKKTLGPVFGINTKNDVKEFQREAKANGTYTGIRATIDGNIGPLTLDAMRKAGFPY